LIKPLRPIPNEVIKIHGITDAMVADEPGYSDIHNKLMDIFKEKSVIIYNAGFDLRMILQSGSGLSFSGIETSNSIICAMVWYAEFYGQWNNFRNKLVNLLK